MKLEQQYLRARMRGAPLIVITTADQPAMVRRLAAVEASARNGEGNPAVTWDVVRGPQPANAQGEEAASSILRAAGGIPANRLVSWPDMSLVCASVDGAPLGTAVIVLNAHKLISDQATAARSIQGFANLREPFKSTKRAVVALAPSWESPAELGSDVYVIDDELPGAEERQAVASKLIDSAIEKGANIADRDQAIETAARLTRGLSPFALEQTVSLSLEQTGLDEAELAQRFRTVVNGTPGLTFEPEPVPVKSIGGLENFKEFARALAGARRKPKAIVFVDEIEKALAGSGGAAGGDTSGVSQNILGYLLTWMEDHSASGIIALGPPGSGKSMSAKALGAVLGVPTIRLDLGELKGSLVGQSEANCRAALKKLEALAGDTFWVATCNSETSLPPELRRRYKQGVWFFDLPSKDERESIWNLYLDKYEHGDDAERPQDEGWTGAEIKACCESAWSLNIPLTTAAQWIVPVAQSAQAQIESLRKNADQRYVSASYPGAYRYRPVTPAYVSESSNNGERDISLGKDW